MGGNISYWNTNDYNSIKNIQRSKGKSLPDMTVNRFLNSLLPKNHFTSDKPAGKFGSNLTYNSSQLLKNKKLY